MNSHLPIQIQLPGIAVLLCLLAPAPAPAQDASVSQRLDRIETLLQSQGLLDMLQQLESLQQEVSNLRGELELQNHNIELLQQRQRALYTDIDQRLQSMERPGGATAPVTLQPLPESGPDDTAPPLQTLTPVYNPPQAETTGNAGEPLAIEDLPAKQPSAPMLTPVAPATITPAPAGAAPDTGAPVQDLSIRSATPPATTGQAMLEPGLDAAVPAAEAAFDPAAAQAAYDQAFGLLKEAQYESAVRSFREFLARYPASEYADNAQYWLGEAFYVMRRFEEAIGEYQKLVDNYPDSEKYTHGLLKIGYSYQELGRIDLARQTLQDLVQKHPGTTASRLAGERLQQIAIQEQQAAGGN